MGIFSMSKAGIRNHHQTGGGNFYKPGKHRVRIERVTYREGFKGKSYIIEAEILNTDSADLKPGAKVSQVIKMDQQPALGNIADFVRACIATIQTMETGAYVDPQKLDPDIDDEDADASYGEDQPFAGLELDVYAYDVTTKKGLPFTVLKYSVPADPAMAA